MSSVQVTISALESASEVTAIVGPRISNLIAIPPEPNIVVYLVSEESTQMLDGPGGWYRGRVTVECRSTRAAQIHDIAGAVIHVLEAIHLAVIDGFEVTFWKEGTDINRVGEPATICQRILDFYVDWRRVV